MANPSAYYPIQPASPAQLDALKAAATSALTPYNPTYIWQWSFPSAAFVSNCKFKINNNTYIMTVNILQNKLCLILSKVGVAAPVLQIIDLPAAMNARLIAGFQAANF